MVSNPKTALSTANLGVTLAGTGYKTALMDVDFRRPNLHNLLDCGKNPDQLMF